MKILAITVYAGSEKLVKMTERMLEQFEDSVVRLTNHNYDAEVETVAVCNGADRRVREDVRNFDVLVKTNIGFGKAVNAAIDGLLDDHDAVLVLNNDLEFPEERWLLNLLKAWDPPYVLSPMTNRTATVGATAACGGLNEAVCTRRLPQVSAFCWLVPVRVIKMLRERWGFPLFDPEFFCYGEDDYTSAILRKTYGVTPFKVILNSWVKHLKAQTGKELGHRGGMRKNVKLLKQKMRANKLR